MEKFTVYVLSEHFKIFLFLGIALILAVLILFVNSGNTQLIYLLAALLFLISYILYQAFFRTIQLDKQGVTFRTWFRSYHLKWTDIKTYGVFLHTSIGKKDPLEEDQIEKKFLRGMKLIYVSSEKIPELKNINKPTFICFGFRKWVYDLLKLKLGELK